MRSTQQFKAMRFLLVVFVALLPAPAGAQCGELTWLEAITQALDANQALVAARQTLEAQHKDVAKARATMLPDLVFGAVGQVSKEATFSSVAGVIPERVVKSAGEISETLYNQAYIDQLGAQKHSYVGQQETYQDTRNQTIAAVGQDYIGVLLAEALMALQQQNVELSESSLELTQAQESAGEVPYSNVLRMQSQLYGAEQSMVAQKSSVLQSRFQFNQVRNRPSEEVCTLEPLAVEKDGFIFASEAVSEALADEKSAASIRDYLVDLGLARSPELRSLEAQLMAERRRMKSGRRWLIPSLDAAAAAAVFIKTGGEGSGDTAGAQDGDVFWQLGLQLSWSVLDGGAYIASMNQSKLEFWSLESQRNNTETALEETIRGTAAAAMVAFERIGLAVLQAQAAAENYELVNEAYLDGESMLLNLIDAQNVLISANRTARQALYEFLSDLLTLEQSIAYYPFLEADADARVRELESHLRK